MTPTHSAHGGAVNLYDPPLRSRERERFGGKTLPPFNGVIFWHN